MAPLAATPEPGPGPGPAEPRSVLEGYVLAGPDDAPVDGAALSLDLLSTGARGAELPRRVARTDARGAFRIAVDGETIGPDGGLSTPDGRACTGFLVAVHREAMEPLFTPLSPDEVKAHRPVVLRMKPGGLAFEGRAVDRRTRAPLAGARLELSQRWSGPRGGSASFTLAVESDARGLFRASGLAPGMLRIEVPLREKRFGQRSAEAPVRPDAAGPVDFELEAALEIVVEVTGGDAEPRDAYVTLRVGRDESLAQESQGGRAVFGGLDPQESYAIEVTAEPGGAPLATSGPTTFDGGGSRTIRLALGPAPGGSGAAPGAAAAPRPAPSDPSPEAAPPRRISGRVLGPGDRPLAGASVVLTGIVFPEGGLDPARLRGPLPDDMLVQRRAETDADGRFSLDGLPGSPGLSAEVHVQAKGGLAPATLRLLPSAAHLGGTGMPPAAPHEERIPAGAPMDELTIRLRAAASVAVVVTPPPDWPAGRLALALEASYAYGTRTRSATSFDATIEPTADGRVQVVFDGLGDGVRGAIGLRLEGHPFVIVRDVAAGPARAVAIPAGPGGRLAGRLVLPDGRPAAGACIDAGVEVEATGRGEGASDYLPLWAAVAAADGTFAISDLPAAEVTLRMTYPGSASGQRGTHWGKVLADPRSRSDLGVIELED